MRRERQLGARSRLSTQTHRPHHPHNPWAEWSACYGACAAGTRYRQRELGMGGGGSMDPGAPNFDVSKFQIFRRRMDGTDNDGATVPGEAELDVNKQRSAAKLDAMLERNKHLVGITTPFRRRRLRSMGDGVTGEPGDAEGVDRCQWHRVDHVQQRRPNHQPAA